MLKRWRSFGKLTQTISMPVVPQAPRRQEIGGTDFKARYLDWAVFEHLHASREIDGLPPFDTVRGFFVEGSELYPGAGLRDPDHVQICVRNPKCLKGFFLPR